MKKVLYYKHFDMDSGGSNGLTIGKKYVVHDWNEGEKSFYIVDDNDIEHWFDWLGDKFFDAKDYFKEVIKIDKR